MGADVSATSSDVQEASNAGQRPSRVTISDTSVSCTAALAHTLIGVAPSLQNVANGSWPPAVAHRRSPLGVTILMEAAQHWDRAAACRADTHALAWAMWRLSGSLASPGPGTGVQRPGAEVRLWMPLPVSQPAPSTRPEKPHSMAD